jgi:hypothetical protein
MDYKSNKAKSTGGNSNDGVFTEKKNPGINM